MKSKFFRKKQQKITEFLSAIIDTVVSEIKSLSNLGKTKSIKPDMRTS